MITLLSEISTDFVLTSISDKLAIKIQDIQQLILHEQEKEEEQKALEQVSESMTVTEAPNGGKDITIVISGSVESSWDLGSC
jgi:hypothetical protein